MSSQLAKSTIDGIAVLTVTRPNTARTVVMLHGFGANYDDLADLPAHLDPDREWNWIFPNGIIAVPIGPHLLGQAWFPIRMAELEAAAMRGELVDFADAVPDGMLEARRRLTSLVSKLPIPPGCLVLGGFSQGAMMAIDVAVHLADTIAGLILFSGTLVNRNDWVEALPKKSELRFLQSHGRVDPLLGFAHAQRLYKTLCDGGLQGNFLPFEGGHEIPFPVLERARSFLRELK